MGWGGGPLAGSTPEKRGSLCWSSEMSASLRQGVGAADIIADVESSRNRQSGNQGNEDHPGLFPSAED